MRNVSLLSLFVCMAMAVVAQPDKPVPFYIPESPMPHWAELMYSVPMDSIGLVISEYDAYYATHPFEKNEHTRYYKRLIHDLGREIDGARFGEPEEAIRKNQAAYLNAYKAQTSTRAANSTWSCLGPIDFDHTAASTSYAPGSAHVYTVEKVASSPDVVYAGTATTGVWRSSDNGLTWSCLTKGMLVSSAYAIEIDPNNAAIVFFGSNNDLYRTTDAGATWATTGGATFDAASHNIKDIKFRPGSSSVLFVASTQGLWRSTNGGTTLTQVASLGTFEIQEIEFKPSNADTMYVVRKNGDATEFWRSINAGVSFTKISGTGWSVPNVAAAEHQRRTEIAVTPAAPNRIYAYADGVAAGGNFFGFYVSNDAGATWTFSCCGGSPGGIPSISNQNLSGYAKDGTSNDGQLYYVNALAASPTDANRVDLAAIQRWVSTDGGVTWTCPAKWSESANAAYIHADIHDVNYFGSELWIACDGGIFYSTDGGTTVSRRQLGIYGTDFWGFGMGRGTNGRNVMLGGAYHNGTMLKDNEAYTNGWICTDGGDGIRGAVHPTNDRMAFSDYGRKTLKGNRTTAIVTTSMSIKPNASYVTGMSSDYVYHPRNYNCFYMGKDSTLWRTDDNGTTFTAIKLFNGGGTVTAVEIAPTNPNVIYLAIAPKSFYTAQQLWRTTDGGTTWTNISLPTAAYNNSSSWVAWDIAVSSTDPNTLWLARTPQYTWTTCDGTKIYKTTDGGTTWTNLSTSVLNGEYITNIEHHHGSDGGLYIGTRRAVYYRNNTLSNWQLFNAGMPATASSVKLMIDYTGGTIRNATSRSIWEAPLYEDKLPPVARIAADRSQQPCARDTLYFQDLSLSLANATRTWSFPGASYVSSTTAATVKVKYPTGGAYNASITVTDANGSNTQNLVSDITVLRSCDPDTVPNTALSLTGVSTSCATIPALKLNSNTITISAWIRRNGVQNDWAGIVFSRTTNTVTGMSLRANGTLAYHWDGGGWSNASGLIVPDNEWTHVAMVVSPTTVALYVNGMPYNRNSTNAAEPFEGITYIGRDPSTSTRAFKGLIDEVCIWNRSLTQTEIRNAMRLTKNATTIDANLVAYYQFNEASGTTAWDRAQIAHATLAANATRAASFVRCGKGVSTSLSITNGGSKAFTGTGLTLTFPSSGTYPNGQLIVSRINQQPDVQPASGTGSRSYWVVDNYGTNANFSALSGLTFTGFGNISAQDAASPSVFKLYKRPSNATGNTWGAPLAYAASATAGSDGSVTFGAGNGVTSFSQIHIVNDGTPFPVEWAAVGGSWQRVNGQYAAVIEWETSMESNNERFEIEKKDGEAQWQTVGSVSSRGNSQTLQGYAFTDNEAAPYGKSIFYRIKQIDFNGNYTYSNTVELQPLTQEPITVFPTQLASGGELHFTGLSSNARIILYNAAGAEVFRQQLTPNQPAIFLPQLSAGAYSYHILCNTSMQTGMIIVE